MQVEVEKSHPKTETFFIFLKLSLCLNQKWLLAIKVLWTTVEMAESDFMGQTSTLHISLSADHCSFNGTDDGIMV